MTIIDEIILSLQNAIQSNNARDEALAENLLTLGAGDIPENLSTQEYGVEGIRRWLHRAEKLLNESVKVHQESSDARETLSSQELSKTIQQFQKRERGSENRLVDSISIRGPVELVEAMRHFRAEELHNAVIEHLHQRLNASWSYVDVVSWERLILLEETPILFLITLPLGKPDKKHIVLGEEHNRSGIHFHYAKLDGARSDVIFAFGKNTDAPKYPVKWERHASGKAQFRPSPDKWNEKKRININEVCSAARQNLPVGTRLFTPSKQSQFLLPI
ncbi:hypothetical protein [Emcibacter sp. SYSU 3D8]|uniref:hypothetical protein n=1 Tax=Emcibacter sp. SYSU 3D8 TaxID=3133969 RepID=UPI0031FEDD24